MVHNGCYGFTLLFQLHSCIAWSRGLSACACPRVASMHAYIYIYYIRIYITIVSFQQLPAMARPRLGGKSKDNLPLNLTARLDSGARNELDFGGCYRKEILRNLQNPRSLQCVHLPESLSPLRKCVVWGCAETEIGRCVAKPLSPKSATARRTGSPC